MIYAVSELLPVFGENLEWFTELEEYEQMEFVRKWAKRAEAHIDRMSFYRLREVAEKYADDVKLAICAVAELLYKEDEAGNVASENTDGYSVTYKDSGSVYVKRQIRDACNDLLGFTGIFQRTIGVV